MSFPILQFLPCKESDFCASNTEIEAFLAENSFGLYVLENFIDLDEVKSLEESPELLLNNLLILDIKLDEVQTIDLTLKETRVELQDDILNLLGLAEPTELKYLNFNEYFREF